MPKRGKAIAGLTKGNSVENLVQGDYATEHGVKQEPSLGLAEQAKDQEPDRALHRRLCCAVGRIGCSVQQRRTLGVRGSSIYWHVSSAIQLF